MRLQSMPRETYPSDLTEDQWSILEPLLPPSHSGGLGRPREVDLREVINGWKSGYMAAIGNKKPLSSGSIRDEAGCDFRFSVA